MLQHTPTATFYPLASTSPLCEYVLLLLAQSKTEPDDWWTAGTAFLISDRLAVSAAHIFRTFKGNFNQAKASREHRLSYLGPLIEREPASDFNGSFDAIQFVPDGTHRRWSVVRFVTSDKANDSDFAILHLEPHPNCSAARQYQLLPNRRPRLQLFPPVIGQKIFLCGWPDDPLHLQGGKLPEPEVGGNFFISESVVQHLSVTAATQERFSYPHFRSEARSYNGMSGGPVLIHKENLGFVICGSHIAGDERQVSRHCILWPLLPFPVQSEGSGMRFRDLAILGEINAPCASFFQLVVSRGHTDINCAVPELRQNGTYLGTSRWLIGDMQPTNLSLPVRTLIGETFTVQSIATLLAMSLPLPILNKSEI